MLGVMANSVTVEFWRHYQLQRKRSSKVHKLRFYKKRHDRRDAGPKNVALPDKKKHQNIPLYNRPFQKILAKLLHIRRVNR